MRLFSNPLIVLTLFAMACSAGPDRNKTVASIPSTNPNTNTNTNTNKNAEADASSDSPNGSDAKESPAPVVTSPSSPNPAMAIPLTKAVVYGPIGNAPGGYQKIKSAKWPDSCTKGDIVESTGPLFPFNENQTLVVRGPLVVSDMIIFNRQKDAATWKKVSDLATIKWQEDNYGTPNNLGPFLSGQKLLENGREVFTAFPNAGEHIVVMKTKMPVPTGKPYSEASQDDVPAIWMLNSEIFKAPSSQYFCNCRGVGSPGGCGELDIAEIIPGNKTQVTTTIYSYEGARGSILPSARATVNFQIYAVILRTVNGAGEVSVLELDSFDFTRAELSDSFVDKDWLPTAKRLNAGSGSLNAPK